MDKQMRTKKVIRKLLAHMAEQDKKQIARIALYTITASLYPFFGVFLPKIAIGILEGEKQGMSQRLLTAMLGYLAAAGMVSYLTVYLKTVIETENMRLRLFYMGDMFRKLTTMDYRYTEDASFYEKNNRALHAADNGVEGIEGVYNKLSGIPAQFFSMAAMFLLVGTLNPLILAALLLHAAVSMRALRMSHNYSYARKEERAKAERKIDYYYRTTHDFSCGKDIRIYHLKERIRKNYETEIKALTALTGKIAKREYLLGFAGLFTLLLTDGLMYGILIYRAFHGMPISTFSMYIAAVTSLMASMLTFGEDVAFVQNQGQYVGDFFRLMEEKLTDEGGMVEKPQDTLEIVFDRVSFRYPGSGRDVFCDLDFTIHSGERLAVVGVNGAGKSTLVKLMTGLLCPTAGRILINGRDIREYRKEALYGMFSVVFQDVNVLAFSIRENISCRFGEVDDHRVKEALERVGLWEKVAAFPQGLDQKMLKVIDENGTDFSGGERQKLSIARGLYKDACMVIMDEPTAALDALAEAEIYQNFSSLVEGKTAVYISHRLASTKFCDKIALFDREGLKEYGTHEELMERRGSYYEMFTVQGKYYQEEGEPV